MIREHYGNPSLDKKLHVALAYIAYRRNTQHCRDMWLDTKARIERRVDREVAA